MGVMRTAAGMGLCLLLVLLAGAAGQVDDDCVATALAATAPGEAAADALSNAVAKTLTTSVVCETGAQAQPGSVGGLSVAVALAISEANMIGEMCSADAEAAAEFASGFVTDELAGELLNQTDGDSETLAMAWLTARGPDVKAAIQDSPAFLGEDGCLDQDALADGLPTAVELGVILSDAVQQIIQAVQCGNNVQEAEQECIWADRMFIGKCIGAGAAPAPLPQVASAEDQDFPTELRLCGEGVCTVAPVVKNKTSDAIAVGPVNATLAALDTVGGYPAVIALCGRGRCVTVPLTVEDMTEDVTPGAARPGDWPNFIGLCGQGECMTIPVNKGEDGVGISVGPVPANTLGGTGDYPEVVGLCGRGVCSSLPVISSP